MRSSFTIALLSALSLTAFTNEVDAGRLFGRVWERRRADLHSELSAEVSSEVSAEVASAEQRIDAGLTAQMQAGIKKLNENVNGELAKLQQQAKDQIAAESKRLQEQVSAEVAKLRTAAEAAVATESKKLQDSVAATSKASREESDKRMQEVVAKLNGDLDTGLKGQFDKLRGEVKELVKSEVALALPKELPGPSPEKGKDTPPKETPAKTNPPEVKQKKEEGQENK